MQMNKASEPRPLQKTKLVPVFSFPTLLTLV